MRTLSLTQFLLVAIAWDVSSGLLNAGTIGCQSTRLGPLPPLLNPQNGHFYRWCSGRDEEENLLSWHAAQEAAAEMSFLGVSGHLATITSAEENAFLTEILPRSYYFEGWIGASDAEVEGEWRWVVGPEAGELFWLGGPSGTEITFADWHAGSGEPNNDRDEDYAMMGWRNDDWNDLSAIDQNWHSGFVVEFSVPEPSTCALVTIGLITMASVIQRRKRR